MLKDFKNAVTSFERAQNFKQNDLQVRLNFALGLAQMGDLRKAQDKLQEFDQIC